MSSGSWLSRNLNVSSHGGRENLSSLGSRSEENSQEMVRNGIFFGGLSETSCRLDWLLGSEVNRSIKRHLTLLITQVLCLEHLNYFFNPFFWVKEAKMNAELVPGSHSCSILTHNLMQRKADAKYFFF